MTGTDERTINDANDRDEASASMRDDDEAAFDDGDDDDGRRRTLFRSNRRRGTGTTIARSQYVAMATVACYCLLLSSRIAAADDDIPPSLRRGGSGAASSYPSRQQQRRRLSKYCPGTYSGKAPTKKCGGYVTCSSGEASSSSFACAGGTAFDVRTGTCTWPDAVNCKTGEDLLEQLGIGDDDDDDGNGGRENGKVGGGGNKSRYCPERYTGRAPTANCGGYVDCNRGVEGLEATCPPETAFDSVAQQCVYDLEGCEMLVGENPPNAKNGDYPGENPLDRFCPEDYSGRAPMQDCEGFVDCRNGEARRSKKCPGSTMYDVMTLTCAYSLSGCDALPGMEPTVSPATQMELMSEEKGGDDDDGGGEEVTGCPDGHTGYLALPGCASYLYCAAGAELSRIKCGDGTLFDERGGYCNWADQVSCDSTASPSDRPTLNPTFLPTADPTLGPVTLDEMGVVYYPVFSDGTCSDDGNFPPDVGRQYLFADAQSCCSRYFPTNMVECRRATAPSPPPTPTAGREWYPDYDNDVCRNDGQAGEFETNFFFTYVECCNFDWIDDKVACLRAEPTVAYYPDYDTDSCRNDGRQSPYENNIFGSLEDCCRFQWIDYGLCITGGRDAGNGNGQGGTMVMVPMDAEPEVVAEFYPDYTNDVCKCDGKQSDFEVNIFPTYQDCCLFSLIHTSTCRMHEAFQLEKCIHLDNDQPPAPSPSKPKPKQPSAPATWYPDMEGGLCRNDGNDPGGFVLATSALICCKRFMSLIQKECRARSNLGSSMTSMLDGGDDGDGGGGSLDDDNDDPCPALKAARRCKGNASCRWDGTNGRCVGIAAAAAPTPRPTPMRLTPNENASWVKPGAAADADEDDECSKENKKQCLKNSDRCTYDASAKTCRRNLTAAPVPSPTDFPTLPAAPAPYYPDYVIHACRNDGEHLVGDTLYDDNTECCKSEGMNWRTCMKYAKGKMTLGEKESRADVVGNPYYPDYFNSVCRNDGRQSPLEENLFDTIWECCQMEWLDRDSCLADAGGG